ncbi:MAG: SpaH/EbpB family LPXTG-anchored major pilin [Oscillospiraceae bacterium]|nr:SpaH/EbpB family LPXTG-anchored major pilin [Oscillospiraceae bacterium]
MKNFTKAIALCMALLLCLTFPVGVSAAEVADATIDFTQKGSLTIYKIDLTNAEKDGAWDSSYVSTGVYDQNVYDALIGATRDGDTDNTSDLGNGEKSYGYAIAGVEFSYLKVADIVQFSESTADGRTDNHVEVLYGIDKVKGADFLKALGLENGAERYANADQLDSTKYFYQSDVLIDALAAGLEANSTTVKNALEKYMAANGGIKMAPTNAYGKTEAIDLELGLYLCVETAVPEMVVSTTNPFLVSLPMTSVNGTNATDGGTRWIYDVTTFPKNLTGIPELEKTLRENINDTGKNNGSSTDITDGYAHTGTASAGDVIDYQIISTLPSITSESTYLTCYTFIDTLSKGLTYNKNDVVLEFFTDEACTDLVTTWKEADGYFTVTYGTTTAGESVMTIEMTSRGLAEINGSKAVYPGANMVNSGFSDCTLRITYQATMDSDNSVVFGDEGNPNDVVLTWKRSNTSYYDTLVDDAHVFTYGIELTKLFSDGQGNFANVEFIVHNDTDNYFVIAELNEDEGIYYVTGHTPEESEATHFIPVETEDSKGIVFIKGLEDDTYTATEVRTDDGYTLLRDDIEIVISQVETVEICDICKSDVVGLVQNDPRYTKEIIDEAIAKGYIKTDGGLADILNNMPQKQLEHHLLTASATVDGNDVNMLEDNGSENAHAPLTVVNTRGFDLPSTGDRGVWMYGLLGVLLMTGSIVSIIVTTRKKKSIQK